VRLLARREAFKLALHQNQYKAFLLEIYLSGALSMKRATSSITIPGIVIQIGVSSGNN
jgi:hypothetical protein